MRCFQFNKHIFFFLLASGSFVLSAQHKTTIEGTVCDKSSGKGVEFANLSVIGYATGTTTDGMGKFKLSVDPKKQDVVVISHINYHKQEFKINDSLHADNIRIYLSPKETLLTDVVISSGLYEQPMSKLTKSADIITHREIEDHMYSNMTDMLSHTPGFTQVWEYHSPIILRGLNSNRLIIMKDGNRRIGTFPGGYFGQDMNIYDSKTVEVVKGPGSVIYGSGAISGIINVISANPFGSKANQVQVQSGYGSNNNEFLELFKIGHKSEKFGISIDGKYRKTNDMVYGNGETAENSNVEDRDVAITAGYKFTNASKVVVNAGYHYGDWGKPRGFNGPTKDFTKIRNKEENFHTDLSYSYSPGGIVESVNLSMYYDNGWRDYYQYKYSIISGDLSTLDLVHYNDQYGGGRLFSILNLTENNKLTTGADGYLFRLSDPTQVFGYYNNTQGEIAGAKNAGQQNMGFFVNDEWQLNEQWLTVVGIRFDVAQVLEGEKDSIAGRSEKREAFSGNFGMVYSPTENTHASFNVGRAFRMPTAEELFTRIISCKGIKEGNPDLLPEYGLNFDVGIRGKSLHQKFNYDLTLFYNIIDNFINEAPSDKADVDFTLANTNAKLMGGEFSANYRFDGVVKPANTLFAGIGMAYVYGIDLSEGNNAPLFGIPPTKFNASLDYRGLVNHNWLTGYSFKLEAEYAAPQNRIAKIPEGTDGGPWGYESSSDHLTFNLLLGLNSNALPGFPKLRFIVKNILNKNYKPFGSYIPAMGRNVNILLSFHF